VLGPTSAKDLNLALAKAKSLFEQPTLEMFLVILLFGFNIIICPISLKNQ